MNKNFPEFSHAFRPYNVVLCLLFGLHSPAGAADSGVGSEGRAPDTLPLTLVADEPLGGRPTRLDYESYDPQRHLLFIAHLGDSALIVFDTQKQRVVTRISGISKVHGVLVVPELGRVYASATGTNEIVVIDEDSLKVVTRVPAGVYPDGLAYAPEVRRLYISDEHGGTDTVIDVDANQVVATIPLGGEVGNTQYDPVSRHIFANVQTRGQLVEIDPATNTVVDRIDLPGALENHGLLIMPSQRLAFIACQGNHKLLVFSLASHRLVATFDVGVDPDVLASDEQRGWVYVASETGVVSLFEIRDNTVRHLGEELLASKAHVVAVDPVTHRVYFPLENSQGKTMLRIMQVRAD